MVGAVTRGPVPHKGPGASPAGPQEDACSFMYLIFWNSFSLFYLWSKCSYGETVLFFMNDYEKCHIAASATQRICFSAPRGLWFLWQSLAFHNEFDAACSQIWLGDLAPFSSPCPSLTWLEMEERRGFRERLLSSEEAALCLCQVEWIASVFGGTEEFWTHSPVSHRESLGGRQGEEDNVRIQLILFQKLCVELDIAWPPSGCCRSIKIFEH